MLAEGALVTSSVRIPDLVESQVVGVDGDASAGLASWSQESWQRVQLISMSFSLSIRSRWNIVSLVQLSSSLEAAASPPGGFVSGVCE